MNVETPWKMCLLSETRDLILSCWLLAAQRERKKDKMSEETNTEVEKQLKNT